MMELVLYCALQTVVSFIASTAFAIIFHAPKNQRYYAGITGAVGWMVYIILTKNGMDIVQASFYATVALTIISRMFSFRRKAPVTIFLITGVFPLVPGAGIYSTGYSMFMNDTAGAMSTGLRTVEVALFMALGMGLVLSMPQILFSFRRKEKRKA